MNPYTGYTNLKVTDATIHKGIWGLIGVGLSDILGTVPTIHEKHLTTKLKGRTFPLPLTEKNLLPEINKIIILYIIMLTIKKK